MSHEPRIYFIKSARSKAIKIGTSIDVRLRVQSIQAGMPMQRLVLLAEIPGDERYEHVLHRHFAEYRIKGEWFRCEGRLAQFVELLPSLPAHVRPPSPRREEAARKAMEPRGVPLIHHPAMKAHWRAQREMMWQAVVDYGVDEFAKLVKSTRALVFSSFREDSRHRVRAEWVSQLCASIPREQSLRITAHMMLSVPTSDSEAENIERRERMKKLVMEVSPEIFGFIEREFPHWGAIYASESPGRAGPEPPS